MERKSILICLEKLGAGGVETAVLSQTKAFLKMGYKVVVLAQEGIFKKKLEEMGAKHIPFEFPLENNYNLAKAQEIIKIIQEEEITQVHIEQFPCILSAFPACQITGVPFVAYLHMAPRVQEETIQWFLQQFDIYQTAFPAFFKMAYKIVAITESNVEYHSQLFSIDSSKYIVKHNSIDFEQYPYQDKENQKRSFLLPARLSEEKLTSIKNGIDIFACYLKKQDAMLKIAGDGAKKEEVEQYILEKQIPIEAVEFLGSREDIPECMAQSDIILGVDRVILEAISCKRLAIITGYDFCKGMVLPNRLEEICKENFSGMNIENITPEEIATRLEKLTREEITQIVEGCYQFAKDNLAIEQNVYVIPDNIEMPKQINETLWQEIVHLEEERQLGVHSNKQLEEQIKELQTKKEQRITELEQELEAVYHSRRWKYSTKILQLWKR